VGIGERQRYFGAVVVQHHVMHPDYPGHILAQTADGQVIDGRMAQRGC
jgi:hypothetical protein